MGNILTAIKFVADNSQKFAGNVAGGNNRANSMGEGLEDYIKNIFSGVLDTDSKEKKLKKIHNTFSYLGNQNNPLKVFKSVYTANQNAVFNLSCIIRKNTFDAFCEEDKSAIKNDKNIKIANIQIENPDNCAQLLDAKLITIEVM